MEDKQETKEAKPEPVMVPVKPLGQEGTSVLVEWMSEGQIYHRGYIPAGKLKDNLVDEKVLAKAVPFGLPWEEIVNVTATAESIANDLRRHNVWKYEDISASAMNKVNRAFHPGEFMQKAKEASK